MQIPMGWISRNWARIGGSAVFGIILFLLLSGKKIAGIETLLWLHLASLMIHQFEEYVYPGGFKDFFNEHIRKRAGKMLRPLNDRGILLVNVALGWVAYSVSAVAGEKLIWLAAGLSCITISNGLLHTVLFFRLRIYNPGLITGCFLFIPFGIYLLIRSSGTGTMQSLAPAIGVLIIGTALIPFSIFITSRT